MIVTFLVGLDELYHHAKFGEGRTTRAGCIKKVSKIWCFFCVSRSEAGALFIRGDIV